MRDVTRFVHGYVSKHIQDKLFSWQDFAPSYNQRSCSSKSYGNYQNIVLFS
jgi:hypothetical protein